MNEIKKDYSIKNIKNRDAIIYKLVDNTNNNFYIGSTINSINNRLYKHKHKNLNHTKNSYKIIENNNYDIIILDKMRVDDIKVLRLYESFYILIAKKYSKEKCLNDALAYNNKNVYKIMAQRPYECPFCNKIIKQWCKSKHKHYCKKIQNNTK
tara:strand:+ start:1143 stop:1601 length:459 start_codon:yes stop_codon:yes gene_type:complete